MMKGGSNNTIIQSLNSLLPGVGRIIRVRAVRFTAFDPAFLLTPRAFPSLSVTVIPARVSLKRIKYTLAAPAQATANQGIHYSQFTPSFLPCQEDHLLHTSEQACYQQEQHPQKQS